MRFKVGPIPDSPGFTPAPPWHPLREPSPWLMQLIALPIGFAQGAIFLLLWYMLAPFPREFGTLSLQIVFLTMIGTIFVHELVHMTVHPMAGRSAASILGFWPSRVLFYAAYTGEITRNRFISILLMPVAVISLCPLLAAVATQTASEWLVFVSVLNIMAACGDTFGAGVILFQVPKTAIVRNQGWRTYWRDRIANPSPSEA